DVDGAAPDDVWAVGAYTTGRGLQAARILHWDGRQWAQVASPELASSEYNLLGVSALSATDAWAVGTRTEDGRTRTLVEHWDGQSWSVLPSPNTSHPENILYSVVAVARDDVWAAGRDGIAGDARPLMLHWNGSNWSNVELPRVNARMAELLSVDIVPGTGEVWTVGTYADRNLALRYVPCTAGEGTPGGGIPGMPRTGVEDAGTLQLRAVASAAYDAIASIFALLKHSQGLS
ncbi:MAG: hypothetical protein M3328_05755, partial [Chloroflexota bacterium]|nr:hypothetical protein [Chloroflexota bacterium]